MVEIGTREFPSKQLECYRHVNGKWMRFCEMAIWVHNVALTRLMIASSVVINLLNPIRNFTYHQV
jgi:hypothetical protein